MNLNLHAVYSNLHSIGIHEFDQKYDFAFRLLNPKPICWQSVIKSTLLAFAFGSQENSTSSSR